MKKIVSICIAIVVLFVWVGYSKSASTVSISKSVSRSDLAEIREIIVDDMYEKVKREVINDMNSPVKLVADIMDFKKELLITRVNKEGNIYYITGKVAGIKAVTLVNIESPDGKYRLNKGDTFKLFVFFRCVVMETGFGEKRLIDEEYIPISGYALKFPEVRAALKQKKFM